MTVARVLTSAQTRTGHPGAAIAGLVAARTRLPDAWTRAPDRSGPGAPGAAWDFAAIAIRPKLEVGGADDPLEQEADRVADRVMWMPDPALSLTPAAPRISRKYAACEEKDGMVRPQRAAASPDYAGAAPDSVRAAIAGPGRPLDAATRRFFEPRFKRDFGDIRLHDDAAAGRSAREIAALAYAAGRHIVVDPGRTPAGGPDHRRLLAHELAHAVQQGGGAPAQVRRKLAVEKPGDNIANPGGRGLTQSNAATIQKYLTTLCKDGTPTVDAGTGAVNIAAAFCTAPGLAPGEYGPPAPAPAALSKTATGCGCICDLVNSANAWTIKVDDNDWPHTNFDDQDKADGKTPGGSGGTVTAPSPNSPKLWGAATASGAALNIDPWLVLGHEMCGHAWLGNSGQHGPDDAVARGEGGHQKTVERENALRAEHGIDLRGTFKDPNCGESFWRGKATPGGTPNWSGFRAVCERWRQNYNKANGTSYKITDKIP